MLASLTWLLVFQLAGEVLGRLSGLPVPGPVIGMGLLFAALLVRGGVPDALEGAARGLLGHLSLLFVPAGTGVMVHLSLVADEWAGLSGAVVVGTLLSVAVTGLAVHWLDRPPGNEAVDGGPEEGR